MCVIATQLPREVCTVYISPGDVYLGGIFSLHGAGGDLAMETCEGLLPVSALQLTEAMAFAVNTINQDHVVLPNITLGFIIHDDCSWPEYAMWGSLSLALGAQPSLEGNYCNIPGNKIGSENGLLFGIIGTGETSSSEVAINTAQLFKKPLVSYGATEQDLHGEHGHPYFFGTIPSDSHKAEAIVDILVHFKWEYIAVVYSSDHEKLHLLHDVRDLAEERGMCMYVEAMLSEVPTQAELQIMVEILQYNPHAQVVVLLLSSAAAANSVLSAVRSAEPPLTRTWLASDSWGTELAHDGAHGGIFIEYRRPELVEFEKYFRSLVTGHETTTNPWFGEFCGDSGICQTSSEDGFSKEIATLAPTIDAVLALAYALDKTISDICNNSFSVCLGANDFGETLLSNLQNVSLSGTMGDFKFEGNFVPAHVTVRNMQKQTDDTFKMVDIGSWSSVHSETKRLVINETLIQWSEGNHDTPSSVCRDVCPLGSVEEIDSSKKCCWKCRACRVDDIVKGTSCDRCQQNEWPNANFTVCERLVAKTVTWDDPFVVMLVCMTTVGILLCAMSSYGMIRHRQHPLIKASSRELSCVNLIGLILAFVAVFPHLCPPSAGSCSAAQVMYVLAFTLMYAPLLLKVNRIYRIFESSTKTVKRPRFIGSTAQLVIVAALSIIQASVNALICT